MGRIDIEIHSPAMLQTSSKPLAPRTDESWLKLSVSEEEEGLLEEVCMGDEASGVGVVVKSRSCTLKSLSAPASGPLSCMSMGGEAAVQAVTGLKGLLLLWMFGDACSRGRGGEERLHGWGPCLCVMLGAQAAIQHTRDTAHTQTRGWKGRVCSVVVWLLPLYWLGLVLCLWPIHLARLALPPPPVTVEAPSADSLGSVPAYVGRWEVVLVLVGAQAWGLAPTPPQSPELWRARTGVWGYLSVQGGLLLAFPIIQPLLALSIRRARGLLRRCGGGGLGGLLGLSLGMCLTPVLLQSAYTTTDTHTNSAAQQDSVWGVVLLLAVCVPWLLTGALTVLYCQEGGVKASGASGSVSGLRLGMVADALALTAVALAYAPLPAPLQHAAYWVLLPWVCGVLVHVMVQPSVRYGSVLGCHVLGVSPLQALGGALALPLMATHTGVTDVWLPGLVLGLQGLDKTHIAHYITQGHGIRGLGLGVALFALVLSWTLAAALHHSLQGCLCGRLCPGLAPPLPLPPPLAPAPWHRGSSALSRALCFLKPLCVCLCLHAPVLPSARGDESDDEEEMQEVEMGGHAGGGRPGQRHGRKASLGQDTATGAMV